LNPAERAAKTVYPSERPSIGTSPTIETSQSAARGRHGLTTNKLVPGEKSITKSGTSGPELGVPITTFRCDLDVVRPLFLQPDRSTSWRNAQLFVDDCPHTARW
jgi:hypothetical protein